MFSGPYSRLINHKIIRQRTPGKLATTTYANEIAGVLNEVRANGRMGQPDIPGVPIAGVPFRAKIKTAANSSGVAIVNTFDGTNIGGDDIPVRVFVNFAVGQTLFAEQVSPDSGVNYNSAVVVFQESGAKLYDLFKVRLSSDGGSAGTNKSSACTLTYTIKDITNTTTLATATALTGKGNGWRGLKLQLTAATYGDAYLNGNTVVLVNADEIPAGEQDCS